MAIRPSVVLFDAMGTLFSLAPVRTRMEMVGIPGALLEAWLAQLARDGLALDATGIYQPFSRLAAGSLSVLLSQRGLPASEEAVQRVIESFSEVFPYPDAATAFRILRDAGIRVGVLTGGGVEPLREALRRGGLSDSVDRLVATDEARHWTPLPDVYRYAATRFEADLSDCALVAAHACDVHGAHRAGMVTAWVSRLEKQFHPAMGRPDVSGATLVEACRALLSLPLLEPAEQWQAQRL